MDSKILCEIYTRLYEIFMMLDGKKNPVKSFVLRISKELDMLLRHKENCSWSEIHICSRFLVIMGTAGGLSVPL